MAILTAMQSAAIRLMGQRPNAFFGASNNFELEIADLVNEVAEDIAASHDWQALISFHDITGDGEEADFDLPSDYQRMLLNSDMLDSAGWAWGYQRYGDINAFRYAQTHNFGASPGGWAIYGGQFHFQPAPADAAVASFPYISKNFARDAATAEGKPAFTIDSDEFLLPERLLSLGLIWRWRENKKLDSTGDQEAFAKAISEYASRDKGSRVFRRGSGLALRGTYPAWPWALGPA